jgi:hypothetical protein
MPKLKYSLSKTPMGLTIVVLNSEVYWLQRLDFGVFLAELSTNGGSAGNWGENNEYEMQLKYSQEDAFPEMLNEVGPKK